MNESEVFFKEVGCKYKRDHEGMLVYVGEDGEQAFNTPYFDKEMITNYTVQVRKINSYTLNRIMFSGWSFCELVLYSSTNLIENCE